MLKIKGCNLLLRTLVHRRADGVVEMISFDTLKSRRSPIGEVLRQVVRGCSSRRTICHHRFLLLQPVNPKGLGLINRTKNAYPQRMQALLLDAARVFYAGKRSEGKVSLPLCSLTIWYYRYALTLLIAKPDPAHAWHSELNTSLGTTTWNQPNRFDSTSMSNTF